MPDFDAGTVLSQITDSLTRITESVKVIGQPVEAAGKIVIPAVVARIGFGAGGGFDQGKFGEQAEGASGGGGGGGGLVLTPVFLIVDSEGERLLTVPTTAGSVSGIVDKVKQVVDQIRTKRQEEAKEEE